MKSKLPILFLLLFVFLCNFTSVTGKASLHASPTFTGVADGAIEEITGIAQLVKLGVEVITDKEKAQALWNSIKNISISNIKEAATGAIKDKWDKYDNSPNSFLSRHRFPKR
jgi:hypothetical protein